MSSTKTSQRRFTIIIVLACALLLSLVGGLIDAAQAQGQSRSVTVTRVIDGDTIEISPAVDDKDTVRLIGVDTPETVDPNSEVEPFGRQASQFTTRQLEDQRVRLEFGQEDEDQFDRLLAYVRLNGSLFNETLLRQGYAQLYIVPPNDRYEARFRRAQQQARNAERGIWGLPAGQLCQLEDRGNGIGGGCEDQQQEAAPAPAGDNSAADDPVGDDSAGGNPGRNNSAGNDAGEREVADDQGRAREDRNRRVGLPETAGPSLLLPAGFLLILTGLLSLKLLGYQRPRR